jgi:hypothetical protein
MFPEKNVMLNSVSHWSTFPELSAILYFFGHTLHLCVNNRRSFYFWYKKLKCDIIFIQTMLNHITFTSNDFLQHTNDRKHPTMFTDIVDLGTGELALVEFKGTVFQNAKRDKFKPDFYGLPVDFENEYVETILKPVIDHLEEIKLLKKFNCARLTTNYGEYAQNAIYFKLKSNPEGGITSTAEGFKTNIDVAEENGVLPLKGSNVTLTCGLGVYCDYTNKKYGVFYKVHEVCFE